MCGAGWGRRWLCGGGTEAGLDGRGAGSSLGRGGGWWVTGGGWAALGVAVSCWPAGRCAAFSPGARGPCARAAFGRACRREDSVAGALYFVLVLGPSLSRGGGLCVCVSVCFCVCGTSARLWGGVLGPSGRVSVVGVCWWALGASVGGP